MLKRYRTHCHLDHAVLRVLLLVGAMGDSCLNQLHYLKDHAKLLQDYGLVAKMLILQFVQLDWTQTHWVIWVIQLVHWLIHSSDLLLLGMHLQQRQLVCVN